MRARARSIWASFSRSLLTHDHLLVALEAGRAHVGLVLAGTVAGVTHQLVELGLLARQRADHAVPVGVQLGRGPP